MYYVGLDVGQQHHEAVLTDSQGQVLVEPTLLDADTAGYTRFRKLLQGANVSDPSVVSVGLEATGPYWLAWYELLCRDGFGITVLNPLQVDAFRNEGIRGSKTDRIDSLLIARIIRFGVDRQSYFPSEALLGLRQLTRFRASVVEHIGDLKRQCLCVLGIVFPEYPELFSDHFSKSALALLAECPLPGQIAQMDLNRLAKLLEQASRGRLGQEKAAQIQKVAGRSCGLTKALDAFELHIRLLVEQIRHLEGQVEAVTQQIEGMLDTQARQALQQGQSQHQTLKHKRDRLDTISGVGPALASQILSEVGVMDRLKGVDPPKQVVALAGIDPRIRQSGKFAGKPKMSKRGSPFLRNALMQASYVAVFKSKDGMFKAIYDKQVARGKHHWVALSHVANKMARVVYAVLSQDKDYEPILA
jgi:transposase